MHLAFEECDEVKMKGLEILGWARYSTIEIEINRVEHARSKAAHLTVPTVPFFIESWLMLCRSRCSWHLDNVMK